MITYLFGCCRETDELKPEQSDWVQDTTKQVYTLLEETPPDGKEFANTVRHILKVTVIMCDNYINIQ